MFFALFAYIVSSQVIVYAVLNIADVDCSTYTSKAESQHVHSLQENI